MASLWMGDLEPYMDEMFLLQTFQKMGEPIVGAKLIKNKLTGAPQGYCFLEFRSDEDATKALLRLNGKFIPDTNPAKRYKLNHATHGKDQPPLPDYSIFVGELTEEVDDLKLYQAFSRYRSVRGAKVVMDQTMGTSKGFGFVRFTSELDQQKALVEMQNNITVGRKPIKVSIATPKSRPTSSSTNTATKSYNYQQQQQSTNYQQGNQHNQDTSAWTNYYNQQYPGYSAYTGYSNTDYYDDTATQDETENTEAAELEEEDPLAPPNVELENEIYMQESEEFYEALEDSKWQPLDNVNDRIVDVS